MKYLHRMPLLIMVFIIFSSFSLVFAQYDKDKAFTFLQETLNKNDKNLRDYFISEANLFIQTFPSDEPTDQVLYMLGNVYQNKKNKHGALATLLKLFFLFPNSDKISLSKDAIRQLILTDKSYAEKKDYILDILNKESTDSSVANRYFNYLETLIKLDQPKLSDWILHSYYDYTRMFPQDGRNDQLLLWVADIYATNNKNKEADITYYKLSLLHPSSLLLPNALYNRGNLLYQKLKQQEQALEILNQVVTEFPSSTYAADALFLMGEIKEKKKKNYTAALADYRKTVEDYPKNPNAPEALWAIALINKNKIKDYPAAIATFNEIVENHGTDPKSVKALEEIANIYKKNIKDYTLAAATYYKIADIYPDYEKSPEHLLEAGSLCEDKLDDYAKAISYYQLVLDKFPAHKKAEEAKKRITKAEQKMEKENSQTNENIEGI